MESTHAEQSLKQRTCVLEHCPHETNLRLLVFLDVSSSRPFVKAPANWHSTLHCLYAPLKMISNHNAIFFLKLEAINFLVGETTLANFGAGEERFSSALNVSDLK